ncbi:MAG: hypothetical protein E7604_06515 [Ruminococcaceae bacterium]|nr:hypothetical protein [Oscillospiraceae bacterium]
MTLYELMLRTNHHLLCNRKPYLTDTQKIYIVKRFLSAQSSREECQRFWRSVRFPGNRDSSGRRMYPEFFIPPYNDGKKYRSILGQMPATHIFSSNLYELEIIRLLACFAPDSKDVQTILNSTLARLKTTCFGYQDDGLGECFDTSLVVLRFLAAAAPDQTDWIQSRIDVYHKYFAQKRRPWQTEWYFRLCLSELPDEIAIPELWKQQNELYRLRTQIQIKADHDNTEQCALKAAILDRCIARITYLQSIGVPICKPSYPSAKASSPSGNSPHLPFS